MTKRQKRKVAIGKMIRTKAAVQQLKDAQRARDLIENGASLMDIFNEFKCTSIAKALEHVRKAFELGGRIIGSAVGLRSPLQDAPPSRVARNLGAGGTSTRFEPTPMGIGADIPRSISAGLQLFKLQASRFPVQEIQAELDRLAGIEPDDDALERAGKLIRLFYGPPSREPFEEPLKTGPKISSRRPKRRPREVRL